MKQYHSWFALYFAKTYAVNCFVFFVLFALQMPSLFASSAEQSLAKGEYLARVGNCLGCHTAKGGAPFAGGRRLTTAFGTFITPNITPDKETGIGHWTEEDFWLAMHEGKSRDGRMLYPSFPYTEFTKISRADVRSIFEYLRSVSAVSQTNSAHEVPFPYNSKPLLFGWRKLFFKQGVYEADPAQSEEWNRGAYLVQGLGHCDACHASRNEVGAKKDAAVGGGQMMGSNWYAPSLHSRKEASVIDWKLEDIIALLSSGVSKHANVSGPMATVVQQSLQYWLSEDIRAMAVYLKSLPDKAARLNTRYPEMSENAKRYLEQGEKVYKKYCQDCHGESGQGMPDIYPALANNRSVTLPVPLNLIRAVLNGGYPPTTRLNPQPYGMPPFQQLLRDEQNSQVSSYIRNAWGNRGSFVTVVDVDQGRGGDH